MFVVWQSKSTTYNTNNLRTETIKTIHTENIVINAFGKTNDSHIETIDVVQLKVKHLGKDRFAFIETIIYPLICLPLKRQEKKIVKNSYQHLYNLKLADRNQASSECVVGIDFYHSFFTGKTIRKR